MKDFDPKKEFEYVVTEIEAEYGYYNLNDNYEFEKNNDFYLPEIFNSYAINGYITSDNKIILTQNFKSKYLIKDEHYTNMIFTKAWVVKENKIERILKKHIILEEDNFFVKPNLLKIINDFNNFIITKKYYIIYRFDKSFYNKNINKIFIYDRNNEKLIKIKCFKCDYSDHNINWFWLDKNDNKLYFQNKSKKNEIYLGKWNYDTQDNFDENIKNKVKIFKKLKLNYNNIKKIINYII